MLLCISACLKQLLGSDALPVLSEIMRPLMTWIPKNTQGIFLFLYILPKAGPPVVNHQRSRLLKQKARVFFGTVIKLNAR